jgi:hypothetical protein
MLALAVSGQARERNAEVGQPLVDTVEASLAQSPLSVKLPDGRQEDVRMAIDAQGGHWSFADTWQSGVYLARFGSPAAREALFAVNVDTAESNLARLEPEELPHEFTTKLNSASDDAATATVSRRTDLNKLLLYMVLGLVFAETLLAWRFGHQQ